MQDKKKKTKKQIRVQDLKPKKDAKGGVHGQDVHQGNVNQNFNQKGPSPSFTAGS
jgi:hypothetical protein